MLINSANLLGGSSEPSSYRGFGRIHLEAGMPYNGEGPMALFVEDRAEIGTDRHNNVRLSVDADARLDLRATLSWIDPAASSISAVQLVNNLDLRGESRLNGLRLEGFDGNISRAWLEQRTLRCVCLFLVEVRRQSSCLGW